MPPSSRVPVRAFWDAALHMTAKNQEMANGQIWKGNGLDSFSTDPNEEAYLSESSNSLQVPQRQREKWKLHLSRKAHSDTSESKVNVMNKFFVSRRVNSLRPRCAIRRSAVLFLLISVVITGCAGISDYWRHTGTVVTGTSALEFAAQEPTVILEGGTFKMWYTCGWAIGNICYATSSDGIKWSAGTVLSSLGGLNHSFVFKNGSTYYFYGANDTSFERFHSADGLTWTRDGSGLLPVNGAGWESREVGNIDVWVAEGIWYALHEARGTKWTIGLATSSDGLTWTEYAGNPVIGGSIIGGCGGPEMHRVGTTYAVWAHCFGLPSDIYLATSTDLHAWTLRPFGQLLRMTPDEGVSSAQGQVADPTLVEVGTNTYLYYSATDTQNPTSTDAMHIKLAISPFSIAQLASGKARPQRSKN
jgi:hypothetical protein